LPHNDQGGAPKPYAFDVIIPDIDCDKCALQIIDVMTDKIGSGNCCPYPLAPESEMCFSVYHSCADIKISGSGDANNYVHTNPGPTGQYTQESAIWTQRSGSWYLDSYVPYNTSTCPPYIPTDPPACTSSSSTTLPSLMLFILLVTLFSMWHL